SSRLRGDSVGKAGRRGCGAWRPAFGSPNGRDPCGVQSPTTGHGSASMSLRHVSPAHCLAGVGLLAMLGFAGGDGNRAQARRTAAHGAHSAHAAKGDAKSGAREAHKGGRHGVLHGPNYHPPYAAIVVDDNSDQTIYEVNADEPRHPASLTKIMTLYML